MCNDAVTCLLMMLVVVCNDVISCLLMMWSCYVLLCGYLFVDFVCSDVVISLL